MPNTATGVMADQRALLTETERAILSGEKDVKDNYRYSVESRVRTRVRDEIPNDVAILRDEYPEIFEFLEEAVCSGVEPSGEDDLEQDRGAEGAAEDDRQVVNEQATSAVDVDTLVTADDVPSSGKEAEARREAAVASLALLQEYGEADSSSLKEAAWEAYLASHGVGSEDELGGVPLDTYANASEPERSLWNNSVLPVLRESEYIAKNSEGERRGGYRWIGND